MQRSNRTRYQYCRTYKEAYKLFFNNAVEVVDFRFAPRERLDVSWRCKEDAAPRNNTAAPVIGKFVLELSQMKLADSLIKDQDDVFYCVSDTEVI